jgi:hypothetical protein
MTKEMKFNNIPIELRSESACINRMKTAIKTGTLEQIYEVLELIPTEILITAYMRANRNDFTKMQHLTNPRALADIPVKLRTETACLIAMTTAMNRGGLAQMANVVTFIPKDILITAFVQGNIDEFS